MTDWRKSYVHILGDTGIELHPQYGSDYWYVVDTKGVKEKVLTGELPLKAAKLAAKREAKKLGRIKEVANPPSSGVRSTNEPRRPAGT
jgi:hypothetical protein